MTICFFCGNIHELRKCPIENYLSPILKRKMGIIIEHHIAKNYDCMYCATRTLTVIGDNSPSSDLICTNCSNIFEVKSKCLSNYKLPTDIILNHGNYKNYVKRLNTGLNLIVLIYGVDRINKLIFIREVLFADNNDLHSPDIIKVEPKIDSKLSKIIINNRLILPRIIIPEDKLIYSFHDEIKEFI